MKSFTAGNLIKNPMFWIKGLVVRLKSPFAFVCKKMKDFVGKWHRVYLLRTLIHTHTHTHTMTERQKMTIKEEKEKEKRM